MGVSNKNSQGNQNCKLLTQKIKDLTNSLKQSKQSNKSYKAANARICRDLENMKSELEFLMRNSLDLSASFDNHKKIYLQEYERSIKQIEQYIEKIKMPKQLQKDQGILDNFKYNDKGYNKKYFDLIFQLKQMFVCPISLDCLSNPVILPSGITINEEFFDKLINKKDPYNNNLIVNCKIHNRFAAEVKEIVEASEKQLINEQLNDKEPSIDTQDCRKCIQTDFNVEAEEEKIADIGQLNSLA